MRALSCPPIQREEHEDLDTDNLTAASKSTKERLGHIKELVESAKASRLRAATPGESESILDTGPPVRIIHPGQETRPQNAIALRNADTGARDNLYKRLVTLRSDSEERNQLSGSVAHTIKVHTPP